MPLKQALHSRPHHSVDALDVSTNTLKSAPATLCSQPGPRSQPRHGTSMATSSMHGRVRHRPLPDVSRRAPTAPGVASRRQVLLPSVQGLLPAAAAGGVCGTGPLQGEEPNQHGRPSQAAEAATLAAAAAAVAAAAAAAATSRWHLAAAASSGGAGLGPVWGAGRTAGPCLGCQRLPSPSRANPCSRHQRVAPRCSSLGRRRQAWAWQGSWVGSQHSQRLPSLSRANPCSNTSSTSGGSSKNNSTYSAEVRRRVAHWQH